MQHLTSEQLLDLDDRVRSGLDQERNHLKTCAFCYREHAELRARRLQLQALPLASPRRSAWPAVRKDIQRRAAIRMAGKWGAAMVTVAFGAALILYRSHRAEDFASTPTSELVAESQELELALQRVDANSVTNVRRAQQIVAVEQEIADIDDQIAALQNAGERPGSAPLWRARIELLRTLLEMHDSTLFVSL